MSARTAVVGLSLAALAAGTGLASYSVARAVASKPKPTTTTNTAYVETAACAACPAGISLDSVEAQAREGSTLFIVRGKLPSSADALKQDVRLVANDVELVLRPHGSQNAFEVVTANRGAGHPSGADIAAAINGDAILINIAPALTAPVSFEIGFWDGTNYAGRIPRSGLLAWTGSGAPTHPTVAMAPAGTDLTSLPGLCKSLPNLSPVPSYLEIKGVSSTSAEPDPRTHVPTHRVGVLTGASALDATSPFAIVAILRHAEEAAPTSQSRAIDKAGTEQLYVFFDGSAKHKGVRTYAGGKWSMDSTASNLTFALSARELRFYWTGLKPGDSFGFVTAADGGCRSQGLGADLQPQTPAT